MYTSGTLAIVGGGLAAAKAAEELRTQGFDGRVVVLAAEPHAPYERPPLSKGCLLGTDDWTSPFVHSPAWYADREIALRLGTPARALDLEAHTVTTDDGSVTYDRLLLATGSAPRRLELADSSGAPVTYLRTLDDSRRLKGCLDAGARIVVIGGGWIGLEVAAAARSAGCEVTVLEALELPLVRVLGPEVAQVFRELHDSHGVDLRTKAAVTAVASEGGKAVVRLADGSRLTADLLVVGVGVLPMSGLAEAAGLETGNGIVVDDHLRASHPDVFAAGDVANAYHPILGRHLRVEHWDNAIGQGQHAARAMLGDDTGYDRLPYFFTDQYDLGIEYVGSVGPDGYDEVVLRGDVPGRVFTAFWLNGGRVLAGMHANDWDAIDTVRSIVTRPDVDLAALRDPAVALSRV